MLKPGDPAPWFEVRSTVNPRFVFDTVAGRYLVLCFFKSAALPDSARVVHGFLSMRDRFDQENACFFGISHDPDDEDQNRVPADLPGCIFFWDFDRSVAARFLEPESAAPPAEAGAMRPQPPDYDPVTVILDPAMRTLAVIEFGDDPERHVVKVAEILSRLPSLREWQGNAPVVVIPGVFEPAFCRALIEYYQAHGGVDSGFMRDVGGKTVGIIDYRHKRRFDCEITDPNLVRAAQARLHRRVVPELKKAFQFEATRIERHIVACYDASTGGHFRAHRDNTTRGTAHRKFAVTINLNSEEFEGGELRFPEFGRRTYKAPTGGACVFSCSVLHEATPVTRGVRYAFLPFLYDEAGARVRMANQRFLAGRQAAEGVPSDEGVRRGEERSG